MKNRLISLMLAALLLVSLFPLSASAADIVDSGPCGENLTWTLDSDGLFTVSGTGAMTDYYSTASPSYDKWDSIRFVVIESGVTTVGSHAFYQCGNLTSITIPEGVTSIGDGAFSGCSSLMSITIPESVMSIGSFAFSGCSSVTSIVIPDSVTSIGGSAFNGCSNLTSITIPDSITSIGSAAFYECSSLKSISLPDSVTSIGSAAFYECSSLKSISLPDSITSIGNRAFFDCSSLKDVYYSGTVAQWNTISIGSDNGPLGKAILHDSEGSCVYTGRCGENLIWVLNNEGFLNISGTGKMSEYGDYDGMFQPASPFYNRTDIQFITIDTGVENIGDYAFCGCSSLTDITLPNGVAIIGDGAFKDCSSLINVTLPDSVTSIEYSAFIGCSSLESLTIPDNVTFIGTAAFNGCSNLTSVSIPETVTSVEFGTFYNCSSLTSVAIPKGVTSIGETSFNGCTSLTTITIPDTVTIIGNNAFHNCKSLTEVYYGGDEVAWKQAVDNTNTELLEAPHIHFNTASPDTHFYTITVPATCETEGYTARTCDCGYEYDRVVTEPALGHDWTPWATLLEPTATTKGIAVRICANDPKHVEFKALPTVDEEPSNPFTDVEPGRFYYNAVLWAYYHDPQITDGVTPTTFMPDRICTRAHVVTFLWRANGCPEPNSTTNPFPDVPDGKYYTKAVLWASEQGITTGYDDGTFRPDAECTRGQVVTFLWRANGSPKPELTTNPFVDVSSSAYYYQAVLWARENGITDGRTPTTFGPTDACTRGHVVTFLYRAYA